MHFTLGETIWGTFALFKKLSLNKTINYFSMQMGDTDTGVCWAAHMEVAEYKVKNALLCTTFGCNNFNTVVLQPGLCTACGLVVVYTPLSWKTLLMSQCFEALLPTLGGKVGSSVTPSFLHTFSEQLHSYSAACIFHCHARFQPFSLRTKLTMLVAAGGFESNLHLVIWD